MFLPVTRACFNSIKFKAVCRVAGDGIGLKEGDVGVGIHADKYCNRIAMLVILFLRKLLLE